MTPPETPPNPPGPHEEERADRRANAAALMTFAAFLGLGFALPFLPIYVRDLGVSDSRDAAQWGGILIGVGPLLAGFLAPFWGGLADRHGYRRVALLALAALGAAQVLAAFARTPSDVLVSRLLSGLFGGVGPLGLGMASGAARDGSASRAIGKIQAAQILAAGFGPLLGGAVASSFGIRAAFGVAAFCCLAAALAVGVGYEDPQVGTRRRSATAGGPGVAVPAGFLTALVTLVFFVNFASRSFTPILPGQLEAFGVSRASLAFGTGVLISVYSIAAAASSFGFGRLAAQGDPIRLLALSLAGSAACAIFMSLAASFSSFLAVALVYGLVSGGALTLGYSAGSRRFGEAAKGAFFGRLSGAALIGGAVAPGLAAFVARFSMEAVYWMNAALYVLLIVVALAWLRGAPSRDERTA